MGKKIQTLEEVRAAVDKMMANFGKKEEARLKGHAPPGTRMLDVCREKWLSTDNTWMSEQQIRDLLDSHGMIKRLPTLKGQERAFRNFLNSNVDRHKNFEKRIDGWYRLTEKGMIRSDSRKARQKLP